MNNVANVGYESELWQTGVALGTSVVALPTFSHELLDALVALSSTVDLEPWGKSIS
jgi:hypothetical protein